MSDRGRATATGPGPVERLRQALGEAASALRGDSGLPTPSLERPPRAEFGDYSTNVAMLLAPALKSPPREIAERVGEGLRNSLGPALERAEVAGPGFLNMFLSDSWFCEALQTIRDEGERFGASIVPERERERVLVEFVSANPTGPLTAASGRHAAYGDSLCRVLAFVGHQVESEYYVNDYGTQVELFGRSIAAALSDSELPEGGYRGAYVADIAARLKEEGVDPGDLKAVTRRGIELMVEQARATLERFRVHFDRWMSEHDLHDAGRIEETFALLERLNHIYSSEGAIWLRTSSFGDDKDRVLRRSSGELTYFASDIVYHEDKRERGFDRLLDVLGADHHGYVGRIKAAFEALGSEPARLETIIVQLVNVIERGERAQMSKRRGEFVTLDDLIDDIGVDAARFFMLQRSSDTPLDLDLDLARQQSQENPVYYVQYAHARIAGILRNAGEQLLERAQTAELSDRELRLEPAERALLKRLLELPAELEEAATRRAPHRLTGYSRDLASDFHVFYDDCRVVGAEPAELEEFRVCLCETTRAAIARVLSLLGVEAPERM